MPINPITVTRLKTFGLCGHSNADGWGSTDHLFQITSPGTYKPGGDWDTDAVDAYWKNIYVATSAQPFSLAYGTPVPSLVTDVSWLEMTIANPMVPGGDHPHASPYDYANNQGACYPRVQYESWPATGFEYSPSSGQYFSDDPRQANGVRHGLEIPFASLWRAYWGEQVGVIKVAFSSTLVQPTEIGQGAGSWLDPFNFAQYTPGDAGYVRSFTDSTYGYYGYWTPSDQFDWNPATDRLYKMWYDKTEAAVDQLPEGTLLDIQLMIPWFGDNDAANAPRAILEANWENQCRMIIKRFRADIARNNWSSLPEEQIRIIWPRVHPGYPGPDDSVDFSSVAYCNGILDKIAADDEFMTVLDSSTWSVLAQDKIDYGVEAPLVITQTNHIGSSGYDKAAKEFMAAFQAMEPDAFDALDIEDALTLKEVRDRVKTYYSKSRANTDMDEVLINQHINAAMYHCFNHVGDNAWWLTRRMQVKIAASSSGVTTLAKFIHRLLVIEDPKNPSYPLHFEQIGHGQGGRLQISFSERGTGTYWCQFVTLPKEIKTDDQIVPAPRNIAEWIIVEACRRMAAASSNAPLMAFFGGESMQLQSDALRNMGQVQRSKREVMRTQRSRPNFGYGGRGRSRWAQDS